MTSNRLRNSLTAALAFTVAATLIVGSAFAADGDNGKFKRRGSNGQLKTGTFQIVVPKADRGGSGRQVAKFVAPKADRTTARGAKGRSRQDRRPDQIVLGVTEGPAQGQWSNRGEVRGAKGPARRQRLNDRSDRGAEGPAWRWTDCCHGRAAEAFRPATACARIRPDARQGRAGRFCSSSG